MNTETDKDGLVRHYGPRDIEEGASRGVRAQAAKELVIDFTYDNLPGFDKDASGGSTPDSFSEQVAFLPAGSVIVDAALIVKDAFAGGTSYVIGTYEQDGTVIDADGIGTAADLVVANLDAGDVRPASGVDVMRTTGTFDNAVVSPTADAYVLATATGTFTAGSARLVITYLEGREAV